jgi:putative tryptophan/tyrosine transport system substrate-binding protein
MKRRDFLLQAGGAAIAPHALCAQQKLVPVIGFLGSASPGQVASFAANQTKFRLGLSETGWVEGQNLAIEYRWAEGHQDRLPALAADLVGRKVDVIVALGGAEPALAAKNATVTIPIVFTVGADPVAEGLVASLARPGGNLTGLSRFNLELMPKRLELLSELVPQATAIALLAQPNIRITELMIRDLQEAARVKGLQLQILMASGESEIDAAFATLMQLHAGGLLVGPSTLFGSRREQIFALASHHAVPAMYDTREYVAAGGLISYGPTVAFRQLGIYAGKILNGAKPADLPVEQPTTFELVVNLKTAEALGLTVPPSILARADEVIE